MERFTRFMTAGILAITAIASQAQWSIHTDVSNSSEGHSIRKVIKHENRPLVELVSGDGELKPYLHVFGEHGERLTEWAPDQQFSHHRGIFIGWNRIRSDLGTYDLWHLNRGGRMKARIPSRTEISDAGYTLAKEIEWHAGREDSSGSSLLIEEIRTFTIKPLGPGRNQVDVRFQLTAARDLKLDGDLQHSGIHFRGSRELLERTGETSYVWEPPLPGGGGKVVSSDLKWCRLIFPIGDHWYSATQLNHPGNPTEELSWRDYGRFGFFFKRDLAKGETLDITYRFITQPAEAPMNGKHAAAELETHRRDAARLYEDYLGGLKKAADQGSRDQSSES